MPDSIARLVLVAACISMPARTAAAQGGEAPPVTKGLARGETQTFMVKGRPAFVILPERSADAIATPWIWYAPTLPRYPDRNETWMFERFLAAGVAIAGIDAGESYGSPTGNELFTALHRHVIKQSGLAPRPCLLARSRGGLMHYSWAAEHAQSIAGIAGIYPVCNLLSYPGLDRAAGAFEMTSAQLNEALDQHNPIARLAPLAAAGVPILHIHGDRDRLVPLASNSKIVERRYQKLGGTFDLVIGEGQGHNVWPGFFQSERLTMFAIERARTTRGLLAPGGKAPADAAHWISAAGSKLVAEQPKSQSLWRFENGALVASPKWDSVVTPTAYGDFRMHIEFCVNDADDDNPEGRGNSGVYIQQRYEVQILDSFGIAAKDYKASYCGSLYRLKKPDRIANRKAGEWQSFDIAFRAARFAGKVKVHDARITVYQNGQLVHDDVAIARKTGAGKPEGAEALPIKLQGHHNEVRFRNFWVQPLD